RWRDRQGERCPSQERRGSVTTSRCTAQAGFQSRAGRGEGEVASGTGRGPRRKIRYRHALRQLRCGIVTQREAVTPDSSQAKHEAVERGARGTPRTIARPGKATRQSGV